MAELQKVLRFRTMLLITINSIMGTGIFFLPALGALYAGPASLISWFVLSFMAVYIAMCFGELVSMYPTSGGIYEFCKHAFGKFPSFLIGWSTLIAANITIAMLIIGAIQYLLPYEVTHIKIYVTGISIVFLLIFNVVAYRGMKTSATMLIAFAFITLITLLGLTVPGLIRFDSSNLIPFFTHPPVMILLAIYFVAETFFGWESPTFLAGETKDGEKIVPKALVIGTIFIALISFIFVLSALASTSWKSFALSDTPLIWLAETHYGSIGITVFTLLVYLSIIGSVADWVVSAPRLILSMAKDKMFIPQLAAIHPKYQTPHRAIIFQTIVSILFVILGIGSYIALLHMLVPILLVLYSCVMICVVILRYKKPEQVRHFKVPFGKIGPLVLVVMFLSLIVMWMILTENAAKTLLLGGSLILLGIPIYLLLQMYYNPGALRRIDDLLVYLTLWTEPISLPRRIREEIVRLLGRVKGKTILEFGCGVGTLTMHLAKEVGSGGRIWATNISQRESDLTGRRAMRKGYHHVQVIQDTQHAIRVHPKVPNIDMVASVGSLGYMQDPKRILTEMNQRMKIGGRVCFIDYDSFFGIIPNVEWLSSEEKIQRLFRSCRFKISIIRKQGFAWKYIFIYGVKEKEIK